MTVEDLERISGVGHEAISSLRGEKWARVSRLALAKICGALDITLDELFLLSQDDIWAPIKRAGEVTIHYGSRSLPSTGAGPVPPDDLILAGQYVGVWDLRAFKWISEYLKHSGLDVGVSLREHVTGAGHGLDPADNDSVRNIFEEGNHVILGSQIANQNTEEVVCHAYGVPPYTHGMRETFPYGFVWGSKYKVASSFGWQGMGSNFGIVSNSTGKLVAFRTTVKEGAGQDCAMIVVYRILAPASRNAAGNGQDRVVICILGHSGAGTFSGAKVATDAKFAARLYPEKLGVPLMRVVSATYTRAPIESGHDNRVLGECELVDDVPAPETGGESPAGKTSRRTKRAGG